MPRGLRRVALLAWTTLLLVACVRVQVQRTSTVEPVGERTPTPAVAERPAVERTPETVVQVEGARSAQASGLRTLFRYRMPPPTALQVARLGIDVRVVDVASVADERGWYWPVPPDAAAHLAGTANPGEPGNIAITGHVDTERGPGVFWRLLEVQPGDEVTVWSAAGSFTYRVTEVRVVPEDDRSVLRQSDRELLTLLTCVPDGRYDHRLVVRAEPLRPAMAQR
ncbi:MAG: class D sortase [Thermomicrobium sp.]|nr:class D sortase [Thermomicrobium sp.]MDW8060835.1 class D sortase [Thermomicrobium sp.]